VGDVFESGTFNGHPVTMAAGLGTLRYAKNSDVYDYVNALGEQLRTGIQDIVDDLGLAYTVAGTDSLFKLLFTRDAPAEADTSCSSGCEQRNDCPRFEACPKNGANVATGATDRWKRLFWPAMRDHGILLPPNRFESQFISDAHTEADVERTLDAYQDVLSS
jgi:glutamate-1-semialdehyde 2,1-aminomutase